ncbi:MAG: alpha-mannosidase [Clostridia bacterium]|nr:alpha-mannosidase [Clostridia bacterium]
MLTDASMNQTIRKLDRLCDTLYRRIFAPVGQAEFLAFTETREPLNRAPEDTPWSGRLPERWGGEGVYGWFRYRWTVPEALEGRALFVRPLLGFYEATLWVNGRIHSNYAQKYAVDSHGNHWCNRVSACARAGETLELTLECYAWHAVPGNHPLSEEVLPDYTWPTGPVEICVRDDELMGFLFDLKTLLSLRRALPEDSFRRAGLDNALFEVHRAVRYDPACCAPEDFRAALREAHPMLLRELARKNSGSAPFIGLTGHSHMDTAWLWPLTETEKKCARTYANQLNLMAEYPEYRFIQSSAFHAEWLRRDYPELFERIREKVREGRWEPNGGVWVECDCNLTGGESLVRQFLWGQRFTRREFGYTADTFWLPDTFGYSSSIPQILLGCGIRYFLTTKMSWNDTNPFPLTTFLWQGIDGSRVLTHLNRTHQGPSPEQYQKEAADIREKRVSPRRLFSFGKGDGGGGPEFEMLEMARRLEDLEGTARSGYTSVSDFMRGLEESAVQPTVWADELYLELHRGTLTNQHEIKHNNRACETALHGLELARVHRAVREGVPADGSPVAPLMETLLVHQFHDILPGTCIHAAHAEARAAVSGAIAEAAVQTAGVLDEGEGRALYNPLSFDRTDTLHLPGALPSLRGARTQPYTDLEGAPCTAVGGLTLPAFARVPLEEAPEAAPAASPFTIDGDRITTPFAELRLDPNGGIASLTDRRTGRELVGGLPFNTFLLAEDVPALWDNWDLDADALERFRPAGKLLSREIVSDGAVELRIRQVWQLTERSSVTQDMVLDAASPLIAFDTLIDWQDDHRFLKAAFDTTLRCDGVRNEIQFGHLRRSNHRSTSREKARFEVCNHKFSDLSEHNQGLALLNDSKYGVSCEEGSLWLSLHKGGLRPDSGGDHGRHRCRYAILPHAEGFGAESVVRPAYAFNYAPLPAAGGTAWPGLCAVDSPDVIIETVKPCEDAQRAYIIRLYEAAGGYARANLRFSHPVRGLWECNMLEEEQAPLDPAEPLVFTPFRIRTVKVAY